MIVHITNPSLDNIREAKQRLVGANVLPIIEPKFSAEGGPWLEGEEELFRGYKGLISSEAFLNLQQASGLSFEDVTNYFTKEQMKQVTLNSNIRLTKSDSVNGAILYGRNPDPHQMVTI